MSAGRQPSLYFDLNIYCNLLNSQSGFFFESCFFFLHVFSSSHVLKGNSKVQSCILILQTKKVELSCVYRTVPKALCCCSVYYIFITLKKIHNNVYKAPLWAGSFVTREEYFYQDNGLPIKRLNHMEMWRCCSALSFLSFEGNAILNLVNLCSRWLREKHTNGTLGTNESFISRG